MSKLGRMRSHVYVITCLLGLSVTACDGGNDGLGGSTGGSGGSGATGGTTASGGSGGSLPSCGNGMLEGSEACDDGNSDADDGCDDACQVEAGFDCSGEPSTCTTTCGDGIVAGSEVCDDGNTDVDDGCDASCAEESGWSCDGEPSTCATTCGDSIIAGAEACDDGNGDAGDGCDDACLEESGWTCSDEPSTCATTCGDSIIAGAEACDDGNGDAGDGCDDACLEENGWTCSGEPSACATTCGDSIIAGAEVCDDGNGDAGDGCDDACAVETGFDCNGEPSVCAAICGDSLIVGAETCDDGNTGTGDGCDGACLVESGFVCSGLPSTCVTVCGDGIVAGAEACDDGANVAGDGCDALCAVETGFNCTGSPSVCTGICGDTLLVFGEQCEDGNAGDGDGCDSSCQVEVTEIEPNDDDADATTNGPIDPFVALINQPGDMDWVAVDVTLGGATSAFITAEVTDLPTFFNVGDMQTGQCAPNQGLDSEVEIYDTDGATSLAFDEDVSGSNWCSLATTTVTADGTYFVRAASSQQYAANDQFAYALVVTVEYATCGNGNIEAGEECDDNNTIAGDGCDANCITELCGDGIINNGGTEECDDGNPFPGDGCDANCQVELAEIEPNDVFGSATPYTTPYNARINPIGDVDFVSFQVFTPSLVTIETSGWGGLGTCDGDSYVRLFDTDGTTQLTFDDDGGVGLCSLIGNFALTPGTYYVRVSEFGNDALLDYMLHITVEPTFTCGAGETLLEYSSTDTPLPIVDLQTTTSQITIPDVGTIQSVRVRYDDITHTYDADLDIFLTSPSATVVELNTDIGGAGDNFIGTFLSDGCPALITGVAPFSNCYAPEGLLSSFIGEGSSGVWTLEITDDANADQGDLNGWTIGICVL